MRKKLILILLCGLAALGLAMGGAMWWAGRQMRTPEFRAELGRLVRSATGREAVLEGELSVTMFPWFGLKARGVSLGNDPSFGPEPLLTAEKITARIKVLPLLARRLVFDTVEFQGATLSLAMDEAGRGNWEGMAEHLRAQENATQSLDGYFREVSVRGLRLLDCKARLDDREHNHSYIGTNIDLRTGRIESGHALPFTASLDFQWPRPGLTARVEGAGLLHWSAADHEPLLTDTRVQGEVGGVFMPKSAPRAPLSAGLSIVDGRHLRLSDVRLRLLDASVTGEVDFLNVTEMFLLEARLDVGRFTPRAAIGAYWPGAVAQDHRGALDSAQGRLEIFADVDGLVFASPALELDGASLKGWARMGFDNGAGLDFDISANRLDVDAYAAALSSNATAPPLTVADLPLDYLRRVHGAGRVRAESLKLAGVPAQGAELAFSAGEGTLKAQLKPVKAQGGSVSGELAAFFSEQAQGPAAKEKSAPASSPPAGPAGQAVLGWSGVLRMEGVDARQVSWLNAKGFTTGGRLDLRARAEAPRAPAAGHLKLGQTVRRAVGEASATLGPAVLEWTAEAAQAKGQPRIMNFSSIQAQARLTPAPAGDADWALQLDGSLAAVGVKPLMNLEARLAGLLRGGQGRTALTGAQASGRLRGWFLPKRENEASFHAKGGLDFQAQSLSLTQAQVQACGLNLSGPLNGTRVLGADWSLSGRVRCTEGDPKRVLAALDLRVPKAADKRALQRLSGEADLILNAKGASLANIAAQLDDMPLRGAYAVQNFDAPRQTLTLSGGNFDLDRYLPAPEPVRRGQPEPKPAPEPLPVDLLRDLTLEANVALRSFKYKNLVTRDFKAQASAKGGSLLVKPLGGNFYGGVLTGEFTAQVQQNALQTRLSLAFKDFQAAPFMVAWAGKEYVTGRTDMFLDLGGLGVTDQEVLRSLEGMAGFKITDGSYNLSGAPETPSIPPGATPAPSRRSGGPSSTQQATQQPGQQPSQQGTARKSGQPFSQATAKLKVQRGVFASDDFRLDGSGTVVTGRGRFSPAEDSINLSLTASSRGLPDVPIKVYGRLKDPEMEVPTAALIGNTIMEILGLPLKPIKFFKDLLF